MWTRFVFYPWYITKSKSSLYDTLKYLLTYMGFTNYFSGHVPWKKSSSHHQKSSVKKIPSDLIADSSKRRWLCRALADFTIKSILFSNLLFIPSGLDAVSIKPKEFLEFKNLSCCMRCVENMRFLFPHNVGLRYRIQHMIRFIAKIFVFYHC